MFIHIAMPDGLFDALVKGRKTPDDALDALASYARSNPDMEVHFLPVRNPSPGGVTLDDIKAWEGRALERQQIAEIYHKEPGTHGAGQAVELRQGELLRDPLETRVAFAIELMAADSSLKPDTAVKLVSQVIEKTQVSMALHEGGL